MTTYAIIFGHLVSFLGHFTLLATFVCVTI